MRNKAADNNKDNNISIVTYGRLSAMNFFISCSSSSLLECIKPWKSFIAPQSFSGGGLVFKGKLVTMERVSVGYSGACMAGYYGACMMGYYDCA